MICKHCGAEIGDGAKFCNKCGKPVDAPEAAAAPAQAAPEAAPAQAAPEAPAAMEAPAPVNTVEIPQPVPVPEPVPASQAAPAAPAQSAPAAAPAPSAQAASAPAAPVVPTQGASAPAAKSNNKIWIPIVIGSVGAFLLIVGIILGVVLYANRITPVDLTKYSTFNYEGYSGIGKATLKVDYEGLTKDYGKDIRYTREGRTYFGSMDAKKAFIAYIEQSVPSESRTYKKELSNGDTVTYEWKNLPETLERYFKVKVSAEPLTGTVIGLREADKVDLFSNINVVFEGIAPYGRAEIEGEKRYSLRYTLDKDSDLKNGDVVTVTVSGRTSQSLTEYLLENEQILPEAETKQFTVEGLPTFVQSTSDLSQDALNGILKQADSVIKEAGAKANNNYSYSKSYRKNTFVGAEYVGNYFLKRKESSRSDQNMLILVYKMTMNLDTAINNKYSKNDGFSKNQDVTYLCAVVVEDIKIMPDGSVVTNSSGARLKVDYGGAKFELVDDSYGKYSFNGYQDLAALKNKLVDQKVSSYDYENNVDSGKASTGEVITKSSSTDEKKTEETQPAESQAAA